MAALRRHPVLVVLIGSLSLALAGCGADDGAAVPVGGGDPKDATGGASVAADPPATSDPAAPAATEPVDVCALLPAEAFAAVLGEDADAPGEPFSATGAVLGGCEYVAESGASATVYARTMSEFQGTVDANDAHPVEGLAGEAYYSDDVGLLAAVPDAGYYLHVMAGTEAFSWDQVTSVAIAEEILARV